MNFSPMEPACPLPGTAREAGASPVWDYQDLALFIGLCIPSLLLAALLTRVVLTLAPGAAGIKAFPVLLVQFLGYSCWFLALFLLLRVRYQRPFWEALSWRASTPLVARAMFTGPLIAFAVTLLSILIRTPVLDVPMRDLLSDRLSIALVGLFAVTLGPVCEELAFRGFLQPLLIRSLGPVAGIALAAMPFALLHGPQYGWSWRHILLVAVAGTAFGWVRYRYGSTAAATAMHATYNLTFFSGFLLQGGN